MSVSLDQWQERMERHFLALSKSRAASGLPLFALEHGLSVAETEEIGAQLRAQLVRRSRLAPHWLLWTIYAAEQGYTYEGGEYWQSFEEATPGWDNRDRYRISSWFSRFQRTYNGFKPHGPWASHFSIIAWPITHAVLPRYLQRQFAHTLYVLRFQLARLNSIEPAAIGRLLATNVFDASTRLEQFLQQEELVGRMVLALLHQQEVGEGEEPLLPATLDRIVCDLESIRNARGWLKETGRVVSKRFKGLSKGSRFHTPNGIQELETDFANQLRPDIRPDLRLHYKGEGAWDLQIDIPSFKDIAALNPEVRNFLKNTRCVLNGGSLRKPAGWLLSGRRQAVLREWPDPERPLINFEKPNGTVAHLLQTECRMEQGPHWLFRIGRDGIARGITSRIVRPGYEYIIASMSPSIELIEGMKSCAVNCPNIHAIRFNVPQELSNAHEHWIKEKGFELARTIRVWPTGFPGRRWDGEGKSEWLTTERPCIGIVSDHHVETYQISLDGKECLVVNAGEPGTPTFLQLSELQPGRHFLTIRAQQLNATSNRPPLHEGYLELRVREPEPWMPGSTSHSGLIVSVDPHDAALNTFWENDCALSVFGPPSRRVTPYVVLQSAGEEEIFHGQVCGPLELPITPAIWEKRFSDFLRREKCEWEFLEASLGKLILDGGDLGRYVVRFEHEVRPLRWVIRQSGGGLSIRLVDETGQEDVEPECYFFDMEKPRVGRRLNLSEAFEGRPVESPGGLFVAKAQDYRSSVIVSTGLTGGGLGGLGVHPKHGHISRQPQVIFELLKDVYCWYSAPVTGYLAGARRLQVANRLMFGVVGMMAGWDWSRTEEKLTSGGDVAFCMDRLHDLALKKGGFASAVRLKAPQLIGDQDALSSWYFELSKRFAICFDKELCRFAVDFASRPHLLLSLYPDSLPDLLQRAQSYQNLIRGARLAVFSRMTVAGRQPTLFPEAT